MYLDVSHVVRPGPAANPDRVVPPVVLRVETLESLIQIHAATQPLPWVATTHPFPIPGDERLEAVTVVGPKPGYLLNGVPECHPRAPRLATTSATTPAARPLSSVRPPHPASMLPAAAGSRFEISCAVPLEPSK